MKKHQIKRKTSKNVKKNHRESPNNTLLLILFIVLSLILLALIFDPKTFLGGDNAHYASLAKSLLNGHYQVEAFIGHPPETGVPPGYPIILAVLFAVFGTSFMPAKIFSLIFFIIALYIWWKLFFRESSDKTTSLFMVTFGIFNFFISEFSHWELTEAAYMLISSGAILFYFVAEKSGKTRDWIILGLLGVASYYIRATGATVSVAIFLTLLIRKRLKPLILFSATIAIILTPWILRNMLASGQLTGGSYSSQFFTNPITGEVLTIGQFIAKFFNNLSRYIFVHLPTLFFPLGEKMFIRNQVIGKFIGTILSLLIIIGIYIAVKKGKIVYTFYSVLYVTLLSMFSEQAVLLRYLTVIYPFIAILLFYTLHFIDERINVRRWLIRGFFILIVLFAIPLYVSRASANLPNLVRNLRGNRFAGYHPAYVRFIEANEWIMKNVPDGEGIISRKPRLTWWFSRHPAKNYLYLSPDEVMVDIDTSGASYVIVDRISGTTQQYLIPAVQKYQNRFQVAHITGEPKTYVLKLLPKPPPIQINPDSVITTDG